MYLALLELNILAILEEASSDLRTLRVKHNSAHALALLQRLADVGDGLFTAQEKMHIACESVSGCFVQSASKNGGVGGYVRGLADGKGTRDQCSQTQVQSTTSVNL